MSDPEDPIHETMDAQEIQGWINRAAVARLEDLDRGRPADLELQRGGRQRNGGGDQRTDVA